MLVRLLLGILKGIVLGGLLGFGLAKLGFPAPGALLAYPAAALTGILVGLVAGKPIWAADGRIEAGLKAGFGALLGLGLMFALRKWVSVPLPFQVAGLTAEGATLGGTALTSLALIGALLGGFYDADNTPEPEGDGKAAEGKKASSGKRIASQAEPDLEEELDEPAQKRTRKS